MGGWSCDGGVMMGLDCDGWAECVIMSVYAMSIPPSVRHSHKSDVGVWGCCSWPH